MSESKTPRTDDSLRYYEGWDECNSFYHVDPDFARTLELELNEANRGRLAWASTCGKLCGEADELRSKLTTAQQEIAQLRKELSQWKP